MKNSQKVECLYIQPDLDAILVGPKSKLRATCIYNDYQLWPIRFDTLKVLHFYNFALLIWH